MKMGRMLIEKKASGQSLLQSLVKDEFPVTPFNPGSRSKVDRVYACENKLFKGYVRVPDLNYAPWVEEFIDEVCEFSDTEEHSFDDQVDAMTQAILVWQLTISNRR
jgi:predicted phage terminase large subunit-like protein